MVRWITTIFLLWAGLLSADQQGSDLAQQVYDRPTGNDSVSVGRMVLIEKGEQPRVRQLHSFQYKQTHTERWSLIRFTQPADINGTGLLTLDQPGDEADQWVYLPALKKSRRIPGNRKGGNFVGSDLFYEDMQDREVGKDHHRILGKSDYKGAECFLLESIPIDSGNSVYTRRVSWIHPKTLVTLKTEFYQSGSNVPRKRFEVNKLKKVQEFWTVLKSTMTDLESGHQTIMELESVRYDVGLKPAIFSKNVLEDPSQDLQYLN